MDGPGAWLSLPLPARLVRAVSPRRELAAVADRSWVIEPASDERTGPAVFVAEDLDRVTRLQAETDRALEHRRVHGGPVHHLPTLAHAVRAVRLRSGHLYARGWHRPVTPRPQRWFGAAPARYVGPTSALACTWVGNRYFGHALTDDLPLDLLAQEFGPAVRSDDPPTPQAGEYRDVCGARAESVSHAVFDRLIVFEDVAQNVSKRERYRRIRERLSRWGASAPGAPHATAVFLRRGGGATRQLDNESEVEQWLQRRGFAIVDPSTTSVARIVQMLSGARCVVGVEGSQLAHAVYAMPLGGAITALVPGDRFNNVFKDYADAIGLRYGFTVCPPAPRGYRCDLSRLGQVLDRLQGEI